MEMTSEQLETFKRLTASTYYGEQDENGVDLSLIDELMEMTVEERLARMARARRSALRLMDIGRREREERA